MWGSGEARLDDLPFLATARRTARTLFELPPPIICSHDEPDASPTLAVIPGEDPGSIQRRFWEVRAARTRLHGSLLSQG